MVKNSLLLLACITLTGCLFTLNSDGRILSSVWDEADVNRLQLGQSDTEWVRTTFGDPTSLVSYADGTEVWKYRNRSEKDVEVGLFLIFSVDIEEERVETLTIEFDQGVVSNYSIEEVRF